MAGPLDNLEEAIRKLQEMYDDPDIVIPASQLPEKKTLIEISWTVIQWQAVVC